MKKNPVAMHVKPKTFKNIPLPDFFLNGRCLKTVKIFKNLGYREYVIILLIMTILWDR